MQQVLSQQPEQWQAMPQVPTSQREHLQPREEVLNITPPAPSQHGVKRTCEAAREEEKAGKKLRKENRMQSTAPSKPSRRDEKITPEKQGSNSTGRNYSDEETTRLLHAVLSPDGCFDLVQRNPARAFKKISEETFKFKRSDESIRGRYGRLRAIYKEIVEYESFTGGDGDPDVDPDDTDAVAERIEKAKRDGKDCKKLDAKTVKQWNQNGWYELFNQRLGENPGISREVEHHSGAISDARISSESEDESEVFSGWEASDKEETSSPRQHRPSPSPAPSQPKARTPAKAQSRKQKGKQKQCQGGVPEPRHERRKSGAASLTSEFFQANTEWLKATNEDSRARLEILRKKEEREEAVQRREESQREQDKAKDKVELARQLVADGNMPEEVREKARKCLLAFLE
ncbi:hypothetical protein GLOTRDRAFT_122447 [Gloeophyllum trabeum ATCC 11539]|uniref:No apical meristem-associated C-terminal domain-containing protein n=1 Tax=Gloeophyllum trabeum (strain ATCC 11539 / FP-39264 / Madison 617) TaxID=670483 RepID=S7RG65_GLOTA|nr:uncharacterized protein GLOTRDRAFT_122447 [Gloeophyllum trabeum ATCC 11539]EPQ53225.1 hypothetical protein GLOTRDRAFT_122447 [Gloeophyllum trabeum ATCC 11539]